MDTLCGTMLDLGCTGVTAGGPTLTQHWFNVWCWVFLSLERPCTGLMLVHCLRHWHNIELTLRQCIVCTWRIVVTLHLQPAKCTAKWLLASAANCGLALTWYWVCIVLTCSGRKHLNKSQVTVQKQLLRRYHIRCNPG